MWRTLFEQEAVGRRALDMNILAVREFANKSAASAASPDYVKFQAVIKSAASAASLRGGRASGRLDHDFFSQFLAALAAKKYQKIIKISDCTQGIWSVRLAIHGNPNMPGQVQWGQLPETRSQTLKIQLE